MGAGSSFVSISFWGPTQFGVAPVEKPFPQHSIWFLTYSARDGLSHYDTQFNAPSIIAKFDGQFDFTSPKYLPTILALIASGGTPTSLAVYISWFFCLLVTPALLCYIFFVVMRHCCLHLVCKQPRRQSERHGYIKPILVDV